MQCRPLSFYLSFFFASFLHILWNCCLHCPYVGLNFYFFPLLAYPFLLSSLFFKTCLVFLLYLFFFYFPFRISIYLHSILAEFFRRWLVGYLRFHFYSGFLSLVVFFLVFVVSHFFLIMPLFNLLHLRTCYSKVIYSEELRKDIYDQFQVTVLRSFFIVKTT